MKSLLSYINEQLITEHFVNCKTKDEMEKYIDIVWDMLQKAYESIGGLAGMDSKQQLIDETDFWKMVRRNGEILCVKCYTFKRGGRKSCYCATNGTKEGKDELYKMISDDIRLKDRNAWAECSGKIEHIYVDKLGATPIPAEIAKMIMHDKKFLEIKPDGYHYVRLIGGEPHEKIMVGNLTDIKDFDRINEK